MQSEVWYLKQNRQLACETDTRRQCFNEQMLEIHLRYLMRMHCQPARLEKFKWSYKMRSGLIDTAARQTRVEGENKKETSCFLVLTCRDLNIDSSDKPAATPCSVSCTLQSSPHPPSSQGGQLAGQVLGIARIHFLAFGATHSGPAFGPQHNFPAAGLVWCCSGRQEYPWNRDSSSLEGTVGQHSHVSGTDLKDVVQGIERSSAKTWRKIIF